MKETTLNCYGFVLHSFWWIFARWNHCAPYIAFSYVSVHHWSIKTIWLLGHFLSSMCPVNMDQMKCPGYHLNTWSLNLITMIRVGLFFSKAFWSQKQLDTSGLRFSILEGYGVLCRARCKATLLCSILYTHV